MKASRRSSAFRSAGLRFAIALTLLILAAGHIFQGDPRDELRQADRLFFTGSYYAALQIYARHSADPDDADSALRLGMIRMIRGEDNLAQRALWQALRRGLTGDRHDLALLYLGQALAHQGHAESALQTWKLLEQCTPPRICPYRAIQHILVAEQALTREDYAAAEAGYRLALTDPLSPAWHDLATFRLTLLSIARDPAPALVELASRQRQRPQPVADDPLLAPLLPTTTHSLDQLLAVMAAEPARRDRLLGQFYLELRLYSLAEAAFARIDPHGPDALAASTYAAYTRWLAGDRRGGLERLEQLVATYPADPRARTLLALAYMASEESEAARNQIDAVVRLSPASPDARLAWASWYAAQRDYVNASAEYRRALEQAPAAEKGRYALIGANFHLSTAYELCAEGLPLAEAAAVALPRDMTAQTTLAAQRYRCADFAGAIAAARLALTLDPGGAEAAYYLGASLAALGDGERARSELIRAADLAPASFWRERAEEVLAQIDLQQ